MAVAQAATFDEVNQLARNLATQLPECNASSFWDIVSSLILLSIVVSIISLIAEVVRYFMKRDWLATTGKISTDAAIDIVKDLVSKCKGRLPPDTAFKIVQDLLSQCEDSELNAMRISIEKEQMERKIKDAGLQGIAISKAGLEAQGTVTSQVLYDAEPSVEAVVDASAVPAANTTSGTLEAENKQNVTTDAHHSGYESEEDTDTFETVVAAEEGRALMSRGRRS